MMHLIKSLSIRSIVVKLVVASVFAAVIPACSLEADHIRLKMEKAHSMDDASQAKEVYNE